MNALAAKKGVGIFLNATKSGLSSLSDGINKTRKTYAAKHESDVLSDLNKKGLSPAELVFQVFQRVYFLYLAGYKHELVAAAQMAGKRLVDHTRTSIPVDVVMILGNSVCNECSKYGDFEKKKMFLAMQDLVTKVRTSKENQDRELLVHDLYYAVLFAVEKHATDGQLLEQIFKDAVSRIIGSATFTTDFKLDPRTNAAKALYLFAAEINVCAQEAEQKRQKALEDAAELLRKENEKQVKINQ